MRRSSDCIDDRSGLNCGDTSSAKTWMSLVTSENVHAPIVSPPPTAAQVCARSEASTPSRARSRFIALTCFRPPALPWSFGSA